MHITASETLSLGFVFVSFGAMWFAWRYFSLMRGIASMREAISEILKRSQIPLGLTPTNVKLLSLWHAVLALVFETKKARSNTSALGEFVSFSTSIANSSETNESSAKQILNLLLKRVRPEVIGGAIFLRDPSTGTLRVEYAAGIPIRRLEDTLLMAFDDCMAQNGTRSKCWGYHTGERSVFNLSQFGIGLSLTAPLKSGDQLIGGIWLAFHHTACALTPERRFFLEAVTTHAAAAFTASRRSFMNSNNKASDRDLLLGISHDLRAPGNSALYAIGDLLSGDAGALSEEQHLRLSIAERALREQLDTLGDILDFTRHQKGFLKPKAKVLELKDLVREILESHALEASHRGLLLTCEEVPPVQVSIDPHHLRRILTNFLTNALKYTDNGEIRLEFVVSPTHLEIGVSDTGIGVPAGEREELFTEFRRLTNGSGRQGVGLGLALSRALAELSGASTFYRPNPAGGSIFGIRLTRVIQRRYIGEEKLRSVLVVDDDPAACRANMRSLRDLATTFVPVHHWREALSLAISLQPSMIVTDLNFKDESCALLLEGLRKANLAVPTLVITGSSQTRLLEDLQIRYHVGLLQKPFDRSALKSAVEQLLQDDYQRRSEATGQDYAAFFNDDFSKPNILAQTGSSCLSPSRLF